MHIAQKILTLRLPSCETDGLLALNELCVSAGITRKQRVRYLLNEPEECIQSSADGRRQVDPLRRGRFEVCKRVDELYNLTRYDGRHADSAPLEHLKIRLGSFYPWGILLCFPRSNTFARSFGTLFGRHGFQRPPTTNLRARSRLKFYEPTQSIRLHFASPLFSS